MNKVHIIEHKEGLVSVVIPTYNHAHFLEKTLQSVLDQSYANWEIIIVDNHSNDNTDSIINNFENSRIKVYKIHNGGIIAKSRNFGINKANGEYIAFLDSDDWWYKNKLQKSVNILNNGFDLVCHAEDWVKDGSIIKHKIYGPKRNSSYKNLLYKKNCISTSAVTTRKDSLLTVGCFVEEAQAIGVEDYHLWLKLSRKNYKFEFIEDILGCYRVHNLSQSSNLINQMHSELWVLKDHFNSISKMSFLDHILKIIRYVRLFIKSAFRLAINFFHF